MDKKARELVKEHQESLREEQEAKTLVPARDECGNDDGVMASVEQTIDVVAPHLDEARTQSPLFSRRKGEELAKTLNEESEKDKATRVSKKRKHRQYGANELRRSKRKKTR